MIKVSALHYYPVKSMKSIALNQARLDDFGFEHDRRFMLIDSQGCFITQRKHPILSQFSARFEQDGLVIKGPGLPGERFSLAEFTGEASVRVWEDEVRAQVVYGEAMRIISSALGFEVGLAYMSDESFRQVDRNFVPKDQRVSFADAFPVLLCNEASLADLNDRLESPVPMMRFRPNIVISGAEAFAEDEWSAIRIGDVVFDCVKPCSRCVMTTIDEQGNKGKEPLRTLAQYRKNEFGVCFGENLVARENGMISVGDSVEVIA